MRLIALFTLSALGAFAQSCPGVLSPQVLNYTFPSYGTRGPSQTVSITTAGAWSFNGTNQNIAITASGATSGTGNATVYVYSPTANFQAPGSYTENDTFTINGATCGMQVNWTVTARTPYTYTNPLGIADNTLAGSSKTADAWVVGNDLIPMSQYGSLPGGSYLGGTRGSTFTMSEFGTHILTCTGPSRTILYASVSPWNANDTVLAVIDQFSNTYLIPYPSCAADHVQTLTPAVGTSQWIWDQSDPTVAYYFNANQVIKATCNFSTWVCTTNTSYYTFTGATTIGNGATDAASADGYIVFATDRDHAGSTAHPNLCWLRLSDAHDFCIDASINFPDMVTGGFNFVIGSQGFDSRTGKRYLITNTANGRFGPRYSLTTGGVVAFEDFMGVPPDGTNVPNPHPGVSYAEAYSDMSCPGGIVGARASSCVDTSQHSHMVQDMNGHQYYIAPNEMFLANKPAIGIWDLGDAESIMGKARQQSGGYDVGISFTQSGFTMGCNGQGWCWVHSIPTNVTSCLVTASATSGSNINLTLATACVATNDPIYVANVGTGCTNANGAVAANLVTISGTTLTIPAKTCEGGSGPANTGTVMKNSYQATSSYYNETFLLHILNGAPIEVRRIGPSLGVPFSNTRTGDSYWEEHGCVLSHNMQACAGTTNFGIPDNRLIFVATGLGIPSSSGGSTSKITMTGSATIH